MERQLDAGAAELLLAAMPELGVDVRLETATAALLGGGRVERPALRGRHRAGGRPRRRLDRDPAAGRAGARPPVSRSSRGIVVDDRMVTSHPRALAVGECAAAPRASSTASSRPIYEQAAVAAETLTHGDAAYAGSVQSAKLKVMGVDLVSRRRGDGRARGRRGGRGARHLPQARRRRRRPRRGRRAARRHPRTRAAAREGQAARGGRRPARPAGQRRARRARRTCPTRRRSATATASARARSSTAIRDTEVSARRRRS